MTRITVFFGDREGIEVTEQNTCEELEDDYDHALLVIYDIKHFYDTSNTLNGTCLQNEYYINENQFENSPNSIIVNL